ncbi:MAG: addiction module antidote protein, HigA family, partial [Chromatiaceae bacterium]
MAMKSPPHPGEVIREFCIGPLGLTVTAAADGLGVSRKTLSELLNG